NKNAEIARLERQYRALLEKAGVTVLEGRAAFEDPTSIVIEPGGKRISARVILVATGARPVRPELPGAHLAITSNEAFELERLPKSILIAGGGYIAVEFASIFHGLGVATTLLYRGPKILRGFDDDLRDALTEDLTARGIAVVCHQEIAAIEKAGEHYRVAFK